MRFRVETSNQQIAPAQSKCFGKPPATAISAEAPERAKVSDAVLSKRLERRVAFAIFLFRFLDELSATAERAV
jgi:hypothetical protein